MTSSPDRARATQTRVPGEFDSADVNIIDPYVCGARFICKLLMMIPWYSMVFPFPHLGSPQDPPLVLNDAVQAYQIGNGSGAWVRDQHGLLSFPSLCP